jgi:hypothetical protein
LPFAKAKGKTRYPFRICQGKRQDPVPISQGSCIADSVDYNESGARRQAQAVLEASETEDAKATWAQGMALDMLERMRVALRAPAPLPFG